MPKSGHGVIFQIFSSWYNSTRHWYKCHTNHLRWLWFICLAFKLWWIIIGFMKSCAGDGANANETMFIRIFRMQPTKLKPNKFINYISLTVVVPLPLNNDYIKMLPIISVSVDSQTCASDVWAVLLITYRLMIHLSRVWTSTVLFFGYTHLKNSCRWHPNNTSLSQTRSIPTQSLYYNSVQLRIKAYASAYNIR